MRRWRSTSSQSPSTAATQDTQTHCDTDKDDQMTAKRPLNRHLVRSPPTQARRQIIQTAGSVPADQDAIHFPPTAHARPVTDRAQLPCAPPVTKHQTKNNYQTNHQQVPPDVGGDRRRRPSYDGTTHDDLNPRLYLAEAARAIISQSARVSARPTPNNITT